MRTFWLAARVAGLFALLVVVVLFGAMLVGRYTLGEEMHPRHLALRALEARLLAAAVEDALGEAGLDSEELPATLGELSAAHGTSIAVLDGDGRLLAGSVEPAPEWLPSRSEARPCRGRTCEVRLGYPFITSVPLLIDGREAGALVVSGGGPGGEALRTFHEGLAIIGLLALVGIAATALFLTRPIRQMSRSMDRIAGGDLNHRVPEKGRDEVARMARSFNVMVGRLVQLITAQRERAAAVSHELRSPLARMKLSIEMLRDAGAPAERLDALEEETDFLDGLVGELLTASRLDLGTALVKPEELDLRELIDECWRRASTRVDDAPELEVDVRTDAEVVRADRPLTTRILGNLLENALRYSGGQPIAVTARRRGERVEISVADQGPGVPADSLERLFDPFYRVDPSRSRRTGGTGLGLMIVRRAVEAHGGEARAESREGEGLTVTFDLPAAARS